MIYERKNIMSFTEKFGNVMNDLDKSFDKAATAVKGKIDEHLTEEKKAEYKEKAANVKAKIDEKLTDEKKAEYKEKAKAAASNAGESISKLGEGLEKGFNDLFGKKG